MVEEHRKKVELKISGMTCATCVTAIEKSLSNLGDVTDVQVNLGNETAMVEYDSTKLKLTDLEKAVTAAGYGVINEKVILKIGGMTCATCVKTVENSLGKLDGIVDLNVNLGAEKAYVHYTPKITTVAEMRKAIEETGYQYLGLVGEEREDLEKVPGGGI